MTKNFWSGKRRRHFLVWGTVAGIVFLYTWYLISGLPSLEQLENPKPELATKVYSVDGEVLDQFYIKNRTRVGLHQLPKELIDALIATIQAEIRQP